MEASTLEYGHRPVISSSVREERTALDGLWEYSTDYEGAARSPTARALAPAYLEIRARGQRSGLVASRTRCAVKHSLSRMDTIA